MRRQRADETKKETFKASGGDEGCGDIAEKAQGRCDGQAWMEAGGGAPSCQRRSMSYREQQVQRPAMGASPDLWVPLFSWSCPTQAQPPGPPSPLSILLEVLARSPWIPNSPRTAPHTSLPVPLRDLGVPFSPDSSHPQSLRLLVDTGPCPLVPETLWGAW